MQMTKLIRYLHMKEIRRKIKAWNLADGVFLNFWVCYAITKHSDDHFEPPIQDNDLPVYGKNCWILKK